MNVPLSSTITGSSPSRSTAAGPPRGADAPNEPRFDRQMPQNIEAEQAVIGAVLIDNEVMAELSVRLRPSDFYRSQHSFIWEAMLQLYDHRQPIDYVTVVEQLAKLRQTLQEARRTDDVREWVDTGIDYLAELAERVPTAANATFYAAQVRTRAVLRELIGTTVDINRDCFDFAGDLNEFLDSVEQKVFGITQRDVGKEMVTVRTVLQEVFNKLDAFQDRAGQLTGLPSGFYELDELTGGFQDGEMIILAARPSMGKCVAADTELVLEDGSLVTIEEVVRRREARLLTLDDRLQLGWTSPSDFVDDGIKPVFRVTTRLGRQVTTTASHPFLTIDGWKPLAELAAGVRVAVPRVLPAFGNSPMRECEVKLLAWLIGDGGLTGNSAMFTNLDPRVTEDFCDAVEAFGGVRANPVTDDGTRTPSWRIVRNREHTAALREQFATRVRKAVAASGSTQAQLATASGISVATLRNWMDARTVPENGSLDRFAEAAGRTVEDLLPGPREDARANAPNAVVRWLDTLGLMGHSAHTKFIPAPVFRLPREQLALFLNRLFATDGWASHLTSGQAQLGYSSVSERLARQVCHLLLRFGIVASLRRRDVKYGDERREAWQIDITDAIAITTFAREIGIFSKEDALSTCVRAVEHKRYQTNRDLIPVEVWPRIAAAKGSESWSSLAKRAGIKGWANIHAGKRAVSRQRMAVLAEALQNNALRDLADSDVYWDEIVSIEPLGAQQVYDLTVPATHNFIANDVCVHNTTLALSIARYVGLHENLPVAFFSCEMGRQQIVQNMLCAEAKLNSRRLRSGHLDEFEFGRLVQAAGKMADAPIFIDDTPGIGLREVRAKSRRLKEQKGIRAVFIDYLQLMSKPAGLGHNASREQEIATISRGLKGLAREIDIPIVVLAQLNRDVEKRTGTHKPRMSDLRESGSIEQDADVIALLHREHYYTRNEEDLDKAELILAKQRNGPTGTARMRFRAEYMRFDNPDDDAGTQLANFGGGGTAVAPPFMGDAPPSAAPRPGGGAVRLEPGEFIDDGGDDGGGGYDDYNDAPFDYDGGDVPPLL
ncbi:MAG: replicative DNA helicase [Planctomycetota bacterium]